jgi:mannosyl-3-phosphoglycerate synthase
MSHVQRVISLDSGVKRRTHSHGAAGVQKIDEETIRHFEDRMAIVIPTKDEKLRLLEGVISGVPHDCLVIVVSNSQRDRVDRFRMEGDIIDQLCRFTHRQALIIHQKDPAMARAAMEAGYDDLLGQDGLVRDGKGEGMAIGLLVARAAGKEYVGFIDADNYFPGSVLEYVRNYAAGFSLAQSAYSMVRILWRYKPKISAGLYFRKWGRISEITNKYLNYLISTKTGFETEVVTTANAGEHAMSMQLAEILPIASGYAVEPQELISLFENFGGILPTKESNVVEQGIDILQIETRNPHLHEERGPQHLNEILLSSLSTIYHSPLCDKEVKQAILAELTNQGILKKGESPSPVHINSPLSKVKFNKLINAIRRDLDRYHVLH